MIVGAEVVVGERPDNVAVADLVGMAMAGDALQLGFQLAQPGDLAPHGGKLLGGDAIGVVTGALGMLAELYQCADRVDGEAEVAGVADEGEAVALLAGIAPLVALRALGMGEQPHLFVIADGGNLDARFPGKIADRQHRFRLIVNCSKRCAGRSGKSSFLFAERLGARI